MEAAAVADTVAGVADMVDGADAVGVAGAEADDGAGEEDTIRRLSIGM